MACKVTIGNQINEYVDTYVKSAGVKSRTAARSAMRRINDEWDARVVTVEEYKGIGGYRLNKNAKGISYVINREYEEQLRDEAAIKQILDEERLKKEDKEEVKSRAQEYIENREKLMADHGYILKDGSGDVIVEC